MIKEPRCSMYFLNSYSVARCLTIILVLMSVALSVAKGNAREAHPDFARTFEQRRHIVLSSIDAERSMQEQKRSCDTTIDKRPACGLLNELGLSLGLLYRARDRTDIDVGNAGISNAISQLDGLFDGEHLKISSPRATEIYSHQFLVPIALLGRIHFLFHGRSLPEAPRLATENASNILRVLWQFAKSTCRIDDADREHTWRLRSNESENHHILRSADCLMASVALSGSSICGDCRYDDGSGNAEQLAAWTAYLKAYMRERAKYGLFQEFFSPVYYKYTLLNFYNIGEFATDPVLRELAFSLLDVWFADWANEQTQGIHGGSKARVYFNTIGKAEVYSEFGWLYFGLGTLQRSNTAPALMVANTSTYKPNNIIGLIATQNLNHGSYEVASRRPGLAVPQTASLELNAAAGGILKYTYVTPSYVMGTSISAKLPVRNWQPGSIQNRWSGLVLINDPPSYIFASPVDAAAHGSAANVFNGTWGVQSKGLQVIQKIAQPFSKNTGPMTVFLGPGLEGERDGDWVFIQSKAYIAFRPAYGRLDDADGGRKFVLTDDTAPVIIQAADKRDFESFASFKSAVLAARLTVGNSAVRFQGLKNAGTITFFHTSDRLPEINGKPVNLTPDYEFKSPFLNAKWGEGVISIQFGEQKIARDFR